MDIPFGPQASSLRKLELYSKCNVETSSSDWKSSLRFLTPILPRENETLDDLSNEVRAAMLTALAHPPTIPPSENQGCGVALSFLLSIAAICFMYFK
jgi:hypothetical protein